MTLPPERGPRPHSTDGGAGEPPRGLELRLLGPLRLRHAGEDLPPPRSKRGVALLARLVCAVDPLRREALRDLLWEAYPPDKAGRSLRVALSDLRRRLGDRIVADRRHVSFQPRPGDRVDVLRLRAWESDPDADPLTLRDLLPVAGPLLDGLRLPEGEELALWLASERERWRRLTARAELALAAALEAAGEGAEAEARLRAALRRAPRREAGHRHLMRLLARQGCWDEALAQFEACRAALHDELGVAPAAETVALRERILAARGREGRHEGALPEPVTPFVGRAAELERLGRWLRDPTRRMVTILGPGGVGKTRLAIEAARRARGAFLDGILFVPLADHPRGAPLEHALATALGLGSSRDGPRAQVARALAERELLLVLDNFEPHVEQAGLCDFLLRAAPRLMLLLTSREALGLPAEQRLPLTGLSHPADGDDASDPARFDAVALFTAAARRVRPDFDLAAEGDALTELCRIVDGLPLALELAAAWTEALDCRGVVEVIGRDVRDLKAEGAGFRTEGAGFPARHLGVETVFEDSWRQLSAHERLAVARLAVFRGDFDAAAARAVAGVGPPLLRSLARKSMIVPQPRGRFRMHGLLRRLSEERLRAQAPLHGRTAAAHATHYLGLVAEEGAWLFGSGSPEAVTRMGAVVDNAVAAWSWALRNERWPLVEAAAEGWLRYFRLRGPYDRALSLVDEAVAAMAVADDAPSTALQARLKAYRVYLLARTGRVDEAWAQSETALADAQGAPEAAAFAHWTRGVLQLQEGRLEEAAAELASGKRAAEAAGHEELRAEIAWQEAVIAYYRDDLEGFEVQAQAILERCARHDLRQLEGRVRESLASALSRRGDRAGALEHVRAARAICEEMDDRLGAINVLGAEAELALHADALADAAALATEALLCSIDIGAEESATVMRWGLATIEQARGELDAAAMRLEQCLTGARAGGYRYWEACALTSLAAIARLQGRLEPAAELLARARPQWREIGHAWGLAFAWLEIGRLATTRGALEEAADALARAAAHADEAADPIHQIRARLAEGERLAAAGETTGARRTIERALAAAEAQQAAWVARECREALGAVGEGEEGA